jgi:hypothetical protein
MADFVHVAGSGGMRMEAHRRWPRCRLVLFCADCSWARDYDPRAVAARLQALGAPGRAALVSDVAARVAWPCPACRRMHWASTLAHPKGG